MSTSLAPGLTVVVKFKDLVARIIGAAFVPHFYFNRPYLKSPSLLITK
jgi:hypothetical protein